MLNEYSLYKNTVIIRFDDERHVFYDSAGNPLLSVTGITSIIDKSSALMGWVAKCMALYLTEKWDIEKIKTESEKIRLIETAKREYRKISEKEADIGSTIHAWISDWIKKKKPEMPEDERVINGITAFLKFQKKHRMEWIESERVVYSKKYRFAGILDAIARKGKDLILIDFKSSNGFYPEMPLQTSGYQIAYEEETGQKINKRMIIRFGKETGEFEIREFTNNDADKSAFLSCLNLKTRLKELDKEIANKTD